MTRAQTAVVTLLLFFLAYFAGGGCFMPRGLSLTLEWPKEGAVVDINVPKVTGKVSNPEATVTVNGIPVRVNKIGDFHAYPELVQGPNVIEVVASLGESSVSKTVNVAFTPPLVVGIHNVMPGMRSDKPLTGAWASVHGYVTDHNASLTLVNNSQTVSNIHRSIETTFGPPVAAGRDLELKAGETAVFDMVRYAKRFWPQELNFRIGFPGDRFDEVRPLPQGLSVMLEPPSYMFYPGVSYHHTVTVETSTTLQKGLYKVGGRESGSGVGFSLNVKVT